MQNLKVELYALQNAICSQLTNSQKNKDFQPKGKIYESNLNSKSYQAWEVPVVEYDGEDSYDHTFTAVLQTDGSYNVDLTLSY